MLRALGIACCLALAAVFAVTATTAMALVPDGSNDLQAITSVNNVYADSGLTLAAETAFAETTAVLLNPQNANTTTAGRSDLVISPIAAASISISDSADSTSVTTVEQTALAANFPNPFNATAKTITQVTAAATTGTANSAVQAIATTSVDDNFGATARSGPITMAAQGGQNTGLTALEDTSTGVAAGATMRIAA